MHTAFPGLTETEVERLPERFLRFTAIQRVQHWLLVLSFGALLLTGLPQRFHDVGLSLQVVDALGGIDNARFLHRIFASIFTIESAWHVVEMALSISRGRFHPTMFFTTQDFRDLVGMLRYSLGFISERPQFDRYDYRQKFEYWGIVFGAIIMVATGATLWFPTYLTRVMPGELIPAAKEMHSGEALLAMLVIVIWHFYDIMLSPAVFPLDTGMITGQISREKLMEEHPREFARILEAGLHEPERNAAPIATPGEPPGAQGETRDAPREET